MPSLIRLVKKGIKNSFDALGYKIEKVDKTTLVIPPDMDMDRDHEFQRIYKACKDATMTTTENMYALYLAAQYVVKAGIEGDFVECGVWAGGQTMIAALTFLAMGDASRTLYLYDTYDGLSEPTEKDVRIYDGGSALEKWRYKRSKGLKWDYAPLEMVQKNLYSTGYPKEKLKFIKGKVEDTIPGTMPKGKVSILRVDTDLYEPTYHALSNLFPKLVTNGVLILDDYGHWQGAKDAVDRCSREQGIKMLLNRIDWGARIGIKIS
jgi:O-methyltransferase